VIINDGNSYNPITGIFTVPADGVYLLSFSIDSYAETHIKLVTDGANTADVVSHPQPNSEVVASNTIVIRLRQGQSVWLEEYQNSDGTLTSTDGHRFTTFSGVFLY